MTSTPIEIGTLIAVVLKARNLPNKRHIGKQDPYCCISLNGEKRRTKAIKRGGQHPEWDEEVRFTLWEDVEDELARTTADGSETPPRPPPKDSRKSTKKKIKGGKSMSVSCYADDPKEPDLIGETMVDLSEVLTKGETDEWFTLMHKDKYCGEVYLELTFWSNEKPPEKKTPKNTIKPNKQYGGPGSFIPSEDSPGGSRLGPDGVPTALRASSSLAQLDLYIPPYESNTAGIGRRQASAVDQITDEFGILGLGGPRRRESFPPLQGGYPLAESAFSTMHSVPSHSGYSQFDLPESGPSYPYEQSSTPIGRPSYRHTSFSDAQHAYTDYQSVYHPPYESTASHHSGYSPTHSTSMSSIDSNGLRSGLPQVPTGYGQVPTPAPSGFIPIQSNPTSSFGTYAPPLSQTPAPSMYQPQHGATPVPSGFMPPLPPGSSMGFHTQQQTQVSQQQPYQYQTYPPSAGSALPLQYPPSSTPTPIQQYPPSALAHPQQYPPPATPAPPQQYPPLPASAPPQHYLPTGPPPSVPPPSQSAPPQPFHHPGQPPLIPPAQATQSQQYPSTPSPPRPPMPPLQQYNASPPTQSSGSRPLPQPGQAYSSQPSPMSNGHPPSIGNSPVQPPHPGGAGYPNMYNQQLPPNVPQSQSSQVYQPNGYLPNPPPPPPPIINPGPPPPLPQPSQYQTGNADASPARPSLPQPPTNYQQNLPQSSYQPIPPPPPPPSLSQHALHSYSLPQPPQPPVNHIGATYYPGPPPRPPLQPHEGSHWST